MTDIFNNLFDSVQMEEPIANNQEDVSNHHTTSSQDVSNIVVDEPIDNEPVVDNEPSVEVEPSVESVKEDKSSLTKEDILSLINEENARKQAIEEDNKRREEDRKKELESIPDPITDIEGFKKWQIERENKLEQSYNDRLAMANKQTVVANDMKVIESKLNDSRSLAEEKFGKDRVLQAEKWATDIITANPEYAVYLKDNPSYEYITNEYNKAMDKIEFNNDPDAFLLRKFTELNNKVVQPKTTAKVPPKSISSLTSAKDPVPEVPVFLKGLF